MNLISSYPRESKEFVTIDAAVAGVPLTATDASHVAYAITPDGARPATWIPVGTLVTEIGFLIGPGTTNDYSALTSYPAQRRVWCQDTDNPEAPVIDCGLFSIT